MLSHLIIRDFVIVDHIELEFKNGFTVLTGETGAGKSILIDALTLILGERADAGVVRANCERADLSAEFDIRKLPELQQWLHEADLEGDEGVCLMRRVIDAGGKSRAFINGRSATLQQLREAGEWLVDIHGQHAHQSLLRSKVQRELLDVNASVQDLAKKVADAWRDWHKLHEQRLAWEKNQAAYAAEMEQLNWQVRELDNLNFSADEWQTLNSDHSRISHAASLLEAAEMGLFTLSESEQACMPQINTVISRLSDLVEYDPQLKEILDVLQPAQIQIQEAIYSLRHYQQKLDIDPQQLKQLEQRLDAVHSSARKYRVKPEQLSELAVKSKARLQELEGLTDQAELIKQEEAAQAKYMELAKKLSAGRRKAAVTLGNKVTAAMQTLSMTGGKFEIALTELPTGAAHGLEDIEFLVSAHAGMPRPLNKVASGGELSRISLAIQVIMSQQTAVPTLIFDEVDVGIGGKVAEIVGTMLKDLGKQWQILCITHLPQVAALGDQHWRVNKTTRNKETVSQVDVLDKKQRVDEIARMLGGIEITAKTRAHAEEMLKV
jgi:DNA repair protein RecN (Recombination protein N)